MFFKYATKFLVMNKKYLDVFFSLAKMQRNAKFKTPYLNILVSQHLKRRHGSDVSTYKNISYL